MELSAKLPFNIIGILGVLLSYAWFLFKHCMLLTWWLFRVEIWLFYYLPFGRTFLGLRLYFPGYYDIWFKTKRKNQSRSSSSSSGFTFSAPKLPENTLHKNSGSSKSKKSSTVIPKVERGNIVILNEYGGRVNSFHPASGGDAVYVDYNPSKDKLVITSERGIVTVCNTNGSAARSFSGNGNIERARWQGNDIFIQNSNGSCELRSQNGGWIRSL